MNNLNDANKIEGSSSLQPSISNSISSSNPAPIGVFWDIENCSIPFYKSALSLVQKIRDRFFVGRKEAEFMCVCDTSNQNKETIQELNDAQVTVVHISAVSKNTADDKIRQALRRFVDDHKSPTAVILISGDVNFASDLSDLRYRHHIHVILIHRRQVAIALTSCAHECYCFEDFILDLPTRTLPQAPEVMRELVVKNLPVGEGVQNTLQRLCKTVRGRILHIDGATALLRFPTNEATLRAHKILNGENVLGQKISVSFPGEENKSCGALKKQNYPAKLSCVLQELQVQNGTDKTGKKKSNLANSVCFSPEHQSARKPRRSAADRRTLVEEKRSEKPVTDKQNFQEQLSQKLNNFESVELLTGDIVIEEEEERECSEEQWCDETVPCQDRTLIVNDVTAEMAENESQGKSLTGTRLKKSVAEAALKHDKTESKSKRRKKHRSKSTSEDRSPEISSEIGSKQRHMKATVETNTMQAMSLFTWPTSIGSKNALVKYDGASGNSINVNSQNDFYRKDGTKVLFLPNQHFIPVNEAHQQQATNISHYAISQLNATSSSVSEESKIESSILWNCNQRQTPSALKTSTPWKCSPSNQFSLESVSQSYEFRRTPGARRPTPSKKDGDTDYSSELQPKSLFSHTVGTNASESSFVDRKVFPNLKSPDLGSLASEFLPQREDVRFVTNSSPAGVELVVSNLDYNISSPEWKKILMAQFKQYVQVLKVNMQVLQDKTSIAVVKVPCIEDARSVIAQLHRKKIGYKRIHVALVNNESASSIATTRAEVTSLLREVTGNQLPLFKFIELFEKRFNRGISVSELCHMKDTVKIVEQEGSGRTVVLETRSADSAVTFMNETGSLKLLESPVCSVHWSVKGSKFLNTIDMGNLPHVVLQIRTFSAQVHKLLQTHDGSLPLISFPTCFAVEFGELETVSDGGVPLEHLITCIPGVQLTISESGIKNVQWAENRSSSSFSAKNYQNCTSPSISQQLSQFGHEITELLKSSPQCRISFSKFIPSYHHHFSRQLRVADYGYTKLLELFEAIPHVAQIIGNGSWRCITLTHRAQIKRFTVDMTRVLKSQSSKQIAVSDLPVVYNKVIGRVFNINEYGVCFLEDLLRELPDSTFTVTGTGQGLIVAMPKKDQTPEEMARTKQFAAEVIDLLSHSPRCQIAFSKFIPAYHHHFGKQCRVADYGFTKLIELFEAIPTVIKIIDDQDEKILWLTEEELLHVLEDQVTKLLQSCPQNRIAVSDFHATFMKIFCHSLWLNDFGVKSVVDLMKKIPTVAKVEVMTGQPFICLLDHTEVQTLACNILLILMDQTDGSISLDSLAEYYEQIFGSSLCVESLPKLKGLVEVVLVGGKTTVKLTTLQTFARDVRSLLFSSNFQMLLNQFHDNYQQHFGVSLLPESYGFPTVTALLQQISNVVGLQGKGSRRVLVLNQCFQEKCGLAMPNDSRRSLFEASKESTLLSSDPYCTAEKIEEDELMGVLEGHLCHTDLLSDPIPSSLPSPDLHPQPKRPPSSLMHFDMLSHNHDADFLMLSEEEKRGLSTPLCRTPVSGLLAFAAQQLPNWKEPSCGFCLPRDSGTFSASVSSTFALLKGEASIMLSDSHNHNKSVDQKKDQSISTTDDVTVVSTTCMLSQKEPVTNRDLSAAETNKTRNSSVDATESFCSPSNSPDTAQKSPVPLKAETVQDSHSTLENVFELPQTSAVVKEKDQLSELQIISPKHDSLDCSSPDGVQKPETVRRSRIAARFDLSPYSSNSKS